MVQHSPTLSTAAMKYVNASSKGLEISPYFDAFVKKDDYNVDYTDYISNEEIAVRASQNGDYTGEVIPRVDFVWTPGKTLAQCIISSDPYDYVVASHVMEHVPNPIGWLNEILRTVRDGGYVILFLPDRQISNDHFRKPTETAELIEWWIEQPVIPTSGQILDCLVNTYCALDRDNLYFDNSHQPIEPLRRLYPDEVATDFALMGYNKNQYMDVHCTVWSADSFRETFQRLIAGGFINVEVETVSSEIMEFLVVLRKKGEPSRLPPEKINVIDAEPATNDTLSAQIRALHRDTSAVAAALPNEEFRKSVEHQLGIIRHDITFLVERVSEVKEEQTQMRGSLVNSFLDRINDYRKREK